MYGLAIALAFYGGFLFFSTFKGDNIRRILVGISTVLIVTLIVRVTKQIDYSWILFSKAFIIAFLWVCASLVMMDGSDLDTCIAENINRIIISAEFIFSACLIPEFFNKKEKNVE